MNMSDGEYKRMAELRVYNVPEDLRRRLKIKAASEDISMNELIIKLLQEALDKPTTKK